VAGLDIQQKQFEVNGNTFNVVEYNGEYFLGASPPAVFTFLDPKTREELPEPPRKNIPDRGALVRMKEGHAEGTLYNFKLTPRLLVAGDAGPYGTGVEVSLAIQRFGRDYVFEAGDTFRLVKSDDPQKQLEFSLAPDVDDGKLVGLIDEVPKQFTDGTSTVGDYDLVVDQTQRPEDPAGEPVTYPRMVRVVDKIRIALVFDDGPSNKPVSTENVNLIGHTGNADAEWSLNSTERVLYRLMKFGEERYGDGVVALFNVVVGPGHVAPKGSAYPPPPGEPGQKVLVATGQRHLLGIHDGWDGNHCPHWWQLQTIQAIKDGFHDYRALLTGKTGTSVLWQQNPPDWGLPLDIAQDTRLEWNMRQCKNYLATGNGGGPFFDPAVQSAGEFVRSPMWGTTTETRAIYGKIDVLVGVTMTTATGTEGWPVAGDTKHGDGLERGSDPKRLVNKYPKMVEDALRAGHSDIVVTFHDWNGETGDYLDLYLEAIEEAIHGEAGVDLPDDLAQRERLVEFVHDRSDLRELIIDKIVAKDFYAFPFYPEMRFTGN